MNSYNLIRLTDNNIEHHMSQRKFSIAGYVWSRFVLLQVSNTALQLLQWLWETLFRVLHSCLQSVSGKENNMYNNGDSGF